MNNEIKVGSLIQHDGGNSLYIIVSIIDNMALTWYSNDYSGGSGFFDENIETWNKDLRSGRYVIVV